MCQPTARWGWLLLLGGLTACGNNLPWANPNAAANAVGSTGRGEPGTTEGGAPDTTGPALENIEVEGDFNPRFVQRAYGSAWSFRTADLDGDGTNELLYGGKSVVAVGADEKPLWTFDLPPEEGMRKGEPKGGQKIEEEYDQQKYDETYARGEGRDQGQDPNRDQGQDQNRDQTRGQHDQGTSKEAETARFFGLHVRDIRAYGGSVLVLDSANRVHRLDAQTGELLYTQELLGDGTACELALLDADGDDIPDYFASGGKIAYSGKDGKQVWEANVDFTPTMVRSGNLDGQRGRELLLIQGADTYAEGICPAEVDAVKAMHEGMASEMDSERKAAPQRPSKGQSNVAALDANGQPLYQADINADITTALIADLDGDRISEAILGTKDGVSILDDQGNVANEIAVDGNVDKLLAFDLNGDDTNDLVVSAYTDQGSTLYAYGMDGQELWNAPLGGHAYTIEAIDLDGDGAKELITGLGYTGDEPGMAPSIAWKLGANGPEELWRFGSPVPARGYAAIQGRGTAAENRVYIAGGDAVVSSVEADTGRMLGTWAAGSMNHDMAAGDLDGDGKDEIITGDVFGNLVVTGGDGERLFEGKLDSEGPAVVTGIQISKAERGNPGYFVVSGYAWRGQDAGILEAYDADGNKMFSTTTPNGLARAKFADLDGDGVQEIVVADFAFRFGEDRGTQNPDGSGQQNRGGRGMQDSGGRGTQSSGDRGTQNRNEPMAGEKCGVMAYDIDGNQLWNTEIASCDISQIAVGDIDGDGADEVAYGELGRQGPYHVALIDGQGNVAWDVTSDTDDAVWLEIIDGGVAFGGRTNQKDGHVTVLEPKNGGEKWRTDLRGKAAQELPGMEDSPFGAFAGSLFGQKLEDINGDRSMDLAFTTADGDVMVVDGQTGDPLFEASLNDMAMAGQKDQGGRDQGRQGLTGRETKSKDRGRNLVGGPLAYVKGSEGQPGYLVVTGYDFDNLDTHAYALEVDTGDVVGSARLDDLVAGVAPGTWTRGGEGIVIVTTFDTYAFDLGGKPTQAPRPSLGQGQDQGDFESSY